MGITRETVQRIAGLVKINLTEAETERLTREMGLLADFADKLAALDTEGIAPTSHGIYMDTVYREDEVRPAPSREEILTNAPEHDGSCFLTPKVLD